MARSLYKKGFWVYGLRLPGHGTSAADLAGRHYCEWLEAVENGYALLSSFCKDIVAGGVGVGGNLSLDLAARVGDIKGVFAVSPAFTLKNYSTHFMPGQDVWNRILSKLNRGEEHEKYLKFSHGNKHINYEKNPVEGIRELGEYLDTVATSYEKISQPVFILQADDNPVVDPEGSQKVYRRVGSANKEFCLFSSDQHVLINGEGASKVVAKIVSFVKQL